MNRRHAPVIGLEIHARLATASKLFCPCEARAGGEPNSRVCPVCLGLPGALPAPNREAIRLAVRLALAVGAEIHPVSEWARKSYFYPDLPKGYQITQHARPLATGGRLDCGPDGPDVPLRSLHVEEDAAKLVHEGFSRGRTGIDFNRSGLPLVELVTEPALRSPEEAGLFLERLRATLRWLGVSDAKMERGSLRCDANVSLRGDDGRPGPRVEIKNLNSIRHVRRALAHEIERQRQAGREGAPLRRETRAWDDRAGRTRLLRGKEHEFDYRYLPEPDLPPLRLAPELLAEAARDLPEPVAGRCARYVAAGLSPAAARSLAHEPDAAAYFDRAVAAGAPPRAAANWLLVEWRGAARPPVPPVEPHALAELLRMVGTGRLTHSAARRAFAEALRSGRAPAAIAREAAARATGDGLSVERLCEEAVAAEPALAERFRAGREGLIEHFVGRVMRRSGGRADPAAVRARLLELLRGGAR